MTSNAPAASVALSVCNLAKRYAGGGGVTDVNLRLMHGSITGFIGVNGAGKSTTLKCILGLLEPDAGQIELFGRPAEFSARSRMGFLPEERGLAPRERARDVIAFHGRLKGVSRAKAYHRADRLLERIGLGARGSARICELSKGNAQRVQLLCALAHDPEVLILDEPFSGLDPMAQAEVASLFAEYRSQGGAILFSTHGMSVAEKLCDQVVILSGGKTVFDGNLEQAAEQTPHGVYVTSPDEDAVVSAARSIGGEAKAFAGKVGEATRWRVTLPREVTHVALMRALAERQAAIQGFEPIQPGLEGAFFHLAALDRAA